MRRCLALLLACGCSPGPVVVGFDEGHRNNHTLEDGYAPWADAVRDGDRDWALRVAATRRRIREPDLADLDVLVVVEPRVDLDGPRDPSLPESAFTAAEIARVAAWVDGGGGLLLVTDHPPLVSPPADLAAAFGVTLVNGTALVGDRTGFAFEEGAGIGAHEVLDGPYGAVSRVWVNRGSAMDVPPGADVLLDLDRDGARLVGRDPGVAGRAMGVALEHGAGRVVMLSEATILTYQQWDDGSVGFCAEGGEDQEALALNIVDWLAWGGAVHGRTPR